MNTLYKYKKIVEKYFLTYQNGDVHIGFGDVSSSKRVRYAGNKVSMRRTGNVSDSRRPPDIVGKCSEVVGNRTVGSCRMASFSANGKN